MSLLTDCKSCEKKFKSRRTLVKHHFERHFDESPPKNLDFYDNQGKSETLVPVDLLNSETDNYKQWLAGIVESINGSLHPQLPGKNTIINVNELFMIP
jgi:hypothetical protein